MINPTSTDINETLSNNIVSSLDSTSSSMNNAKDEKLMESAKDFEAVFVSKFLETMDSTVERNGFLGDSNGEKIFRSMMFQEIGKDIASTPQTSLGFAQQIYDQMK